jgi:SRSO17 transposase
MTQPRTSQPTISFIDKYCQQYQRIFPEVRSYEAFKQIQLGIITPSQRKSLAKLAEIVGLENSQSLNHFITDSPWEYQELRAVRLNLILAGLKGKAIDLIIDETGDPKKGKRTEYVDRQYLGRLGKVDNGIVTVNIYGMNEGILFPLVFEIYKPKSRLKTEDTYQSKPQIAATLVKELVELGFKVKRVLADSLYGESSSNLIRPLEKLNLKFMVAIRSNHGVYLSENERVRQTKWRQFKRTFSDGHSEIRYVQEIIFGRRTKYTYWYVTTDKETCPENSTSYVMTNIPDVNYQDVGNIYGLRTWVEYGFKQCKSELGWADFHLTKYSDIAKWWELICCSFLLISSLAYSPDDDTQAPALSVCQSELERYLSTHPDWSHKSGWKSMLNNIHLLLLPLLAFNLVKPWLKVFNTPLLVDAFATLLALVDLCGNAFVNRGFMAFHPFSSS